MSKIVNVKLSSDQALYLRNVSFAKNLQLRLIHPLGTKYELTASIDEIEEIRSELTGEVARVGFDANYELTREGRFLEDLIDSLYYAGD